MAIKVPDNFRPSDYGIELSVPKPDMECRKNKDGSFSLYARYSCDMSEFAREAAREMNDKMESELIDELLRVNGYVPERTCRNTTRHRYYGFECSECKWSAHEPNDYGNDVNFDDFDYCPKCGAKVVE